MECCQNTGTGVASLPAGREAGIIALEAVMSLPIFLFMMLALYSLTLLFTAQSLIGHALMQSSQSLSLETYSTDNLGADWGTSAKIVSDVKSLLQMGNFNTNFVSDRRWYKETYGNADSVREMCRSRFCSYLAGSRQNADTMLKAMGVVNGVDGLDFSETKLEENDLTIAIQYDINLLFGIQAFQMDLMKFKATQSVCSRLWGDPDL